MSLDQSSKNFYRYPSPPQVQIGSGLFFFWFDLVGIVGVCIGICIEAYIWVYIGKLFSEHICISFEVCIEIHTYTFAIVTASAAIDLIVAIFVAFAVSFSVC